MDDDTAAAVQAFIIQCGDPFEHILRILDMLETDVRECFFNIFVSSVVAMTPFFLRLYGAKGWLLLAVRVKTVHQPSDIITT